MIRLLSLFSGIGAFESALRRGGYQFETVNYCEIDPYAAKAYSQIHDIPEEKNLHDVREVNPLLLDNINLVTYGFPCQDISVAGKQKGFEHEGERTRSGLFFEALRIIEFLQPEYAICENVKALTSKKFTAEFQTVLSGLSKAGYNNYWEVLNAKDYGIPQNRERIFIVSIRKDIDTGTFTFPEKQPLQLRVKDMLEPEVDEKFYINSERAKKLIEKITASPEIVGGGTENRIKTIGHLGTGGQKGWVFNANGISRCLAATDYKDPTKIVETRTMIEITEPVICRSIGRDPDDPSNREKGCNTEQTLELKNDGCSNTLTTVQKDNMVLEPKIKRLGNLYDENAGGARAGNVYAPNGLAPALQTAQGGNRQPLIIEPHANKIVRAGTIGKHETDEVLSVCGISKTLKATDYKNPVKIMASEPKIKIVGRMDGYERTGRVYSSNGIACNLLARGNSMQILEESAPKGGQREVKILETTQEAYRIRKLTPRECFRLMGFTDNDFDKIHGISNTQLYKMAGNSIVVNVLEAIFKQLFKETNKE